MEQHWTCQLSTAQGCYLLICLRFLNWKIQTQVQNGRIEKFHYHCGNFQRLGNEQATSWPFIQDSHLGCKLGAGQPALAALDRLCSRNGFWQWSQVTSCTRAVQNISLASFLDIQGQSIQQPTSQVECGSKLRITDKSQFHNMTPGKALTRQDRVGIFKQEDFSPEQSFRVKTLGTDHLRSFFLTSHLATTPKSPTTNYGIMKY